MKCDQCQEMRINGVRCHEIGCPNAWKAPRECAECGQEFMPEDRYQDYCDSNCHAAYHGIYGPDDDANIDE